jgi:hypothetical protein
MRQQPLGFLEGEAMLGRLHGHGSMLAASSAGTDGAYWRVAGGVA